MKFVADLHLHSKYSRAVSPSMTLHVMAQYARQKGIDILTASDFTHPVWFKEIKEQLVEAGEGVYKLKTDNEKLKTIHFLLSTEISSIYKQGDKLRRIHNLVFVPSLEVAEKVNFELLKRGCNVSADGRPIVGISAKNLLEMLLAIDERCLLIPCHVWTPHFGVYGSASGFDSLDEAFGDLAKYVYGIETGISSDPGMNWEIKELMNRSILSFSDAHSAPKMGREATVFELEKVTYENIRRAIMRDTTQKNTIVYTLEFYPEEGKYHFSGHRNCKVAQGPDEIRAGGNICPVCNRRLTEGVLFRVQQVADSALLDRVAKHNNTQGLRWYTDKRGIQPPYVKMVPLLEVVAESLGMGVGGKRVQALYDKVCLELGSELDILMKMPLDEIESVGGENLVEAITKVRGGDIAIIPGYDGEYGKVQIWDVPLSTSRRKLENKAQLKLEF